MPEPKKGEKRENFIGRCMNYPDMQKYPEKQRAAICFSKWHDAHPESKSSSDGELLIYASAFTPRITKQDNGKFTVAGVPIFEVHRDRGWNCDAKWMHATVAQQKKDKAEKNFLPRLIIGHTADEDGAEEKPVAAYLDNFRYNDSDGWLYADYIDVPEKLLQQFKDGNWPGRSVEVYPKEHFISAVAVLGGTAPNFKLPDLRFDKPHQVGEAMHYSMEFAMPKKYEDDGGQPEAAKDDELTRKIREIVMSVLREMQQNDKDEDEGEKEKNADEHAEPDGDEGDDEKKKDSKRDAVVSRYQKRVDTLTAQVMELREKNERSDLKQKFAVLRIPHGRLDIDKEVDFLMSLPINKRDAVFERCVSGLEGPSTSALDLDGAARYSRQQDGDGDADLDTEGAWEHYQKNVEKYHGDYAAAVRDYRSQSSQKK